MSVKQQVIADSCRQRPLAVPSVMPRPVFASSISARTRRGQGLGPASHRRFLRRQSSEYPRLGITGSWAGNVLCVCMYKAARPSTDRQTSRLGHFLATAAARQDTARHYTRSGAGRVGSGLCLQAPRVRERPEPCYEHLGTLWARASHREQWPCVILMR